MTIRDATAQGVSKIRTRRQRRIRTASAVLTVIGLVVCVAVAAVLVGLIRDGQLRWPHLEFRSLREAGAGKIIDVKNPDSSKQGWQFPIVLTMPAPWVWSIPIGLVLLLLWVRTLVVPLYKRTLRESRHTGFAKVRDIVRKYGARAVRRSGRITLPVSSWWSRMWLPATGFGYSVGHPSDPRSSAQLWLNWEQKLRIIARSGWGKTLRLLVPIIRALPGPALISSVEPEIFTSTVLARQFRRRPARWRVQLLLPSFRMVREYPVFVIDFASVHSKMAAGWPPIRWNPIPGCEDPTVATRRATALVHAGDAREGDSSSTDDFFRQSAVQVLAAWLHAAALTGEAEIADLVEWLRDSNITRPRLLLEKAGRRADPLALMNLTKHLDPKAGKTTSGVERYLSFALSSLHSVEGRRLCGSARDPQFSFEALIERQGTLYLLAEPELQEMARPLLSLIAQEVFMAAERVARRLPGKKRLPQPFIGVLDELKYGVRVANLPYVASVLRKFGISYIYAVQSASQEDALYGRATAEELRAAAGMSLYGGIDPASAQDVAARAGQAAVVRASRGSEPGQFSEQVQMLDTFTVGDQQLLDDGESVILGRGLAAFKAYTPGIWESRSLRREIARETKQVTATVNAGRTEAINKLNYEKQMGQNNNDEY